MNPRMNRRLLSFLTSLLVVLSLTAPLFASGAPAASKSPLVEAAETSYDQLPQAIKDLDVDKDGKFSAEEIERKSRLVEAIETAGYDSLPEAIRDLDRNGDKTLTDDELNSNTGNLADLWWCIAYATVALLFSSLCSVAEAVLLSISPSYVANLEKEGKPSAPGIKGVKKNVDRSLAAILTLNTIAHTIGSGGAGAYAAKYWGDEWVGVAMIVLTLLILFVSEIIPKTIGAVYWRGLAPITAKFIQFLNFVLYPFIFISELITKWLTGGHSHHAFSRDEFAAMADIGHEGGHLDDKESRILKNLFRFPELCAEDIMTPSTVVFALQEDMTAHEVLQKYEKIHFSRIPIYGENRDNTTGFVLKNELLIDDIRNDGKTKLKDFKKRELRGVLDDMRLSTVLEKLLDNREHILVVVDEYGGMEGVVTLEDVVETLIGIEIVDEADSDVDMRKLARDKWSDRMERLGIDVREVAEANAKGDADESESAAEVTTDE